MNIFPQFLVFSFYKSNILYHLKSYNRLYFQISTSAGWSDAFEAISWEDTTDCEMPNEDTGFEGTCGQFGLGAAYMLLYLTLSFLIIVNMYIAVILENYSQVI